MFKLLENREKKFWKETLKAKLECCVSNKHQKCQKLNFFSSKIFCIQEMSRKYSRNYSLNRMLREPRVSRIFLNGIHQVGSITHIKVSERLSLGFKGGVSRDFQPLNLKGDCRQTFNH